VIGAQVGGHGPGVGRFVKAGFLEADHEGAHRPVALRLQQGCDQRGINATREERAEGHIRHSLFVHRGA
jgi:hypothetical protein